MWGLVFRKYAHYTDLICMFNCRSNKRLYD